MATRAYSPFNNPVEDHYIAALDGGYSLTRDAAAMDRIKGQMRRTERLRWQQLTQPPRAWWRV